MGEVIQLFKPKTPNPYLAILNRADCRLVLPWWLRLVLALRYEREVIDSDTKKIYKYKELNGKTYDIEYTGYDSVSQEDYYKMFGLSRSK